MNAASASGSWAMPQRPLSSFARRTTAPRRMRTFGGDLSWSERTAKRRPSPETVAVSPEASTALTSVGEASSTTATTRLSTIDVLLEHPVDRRLRLGRLVGQVHVRFRPAVAVPPVVVEQAPAHGGVGRLLVGTAQRRPDGQAAGIGVLAVGLEHHLAGHLGGELGVRRQRLPQPLTDEERRFLRIFVHGVVDEAKFVHAPQARTAGGPWPAWGWSPGCRRRAPSAIRPASPPRRP